MQLSARFLSLIDKHKIAICIGLLYFISLQECGIVQTLPYLVWLPLAFYFSRMTSRKKKAILVGGTAIVFLALLLSVSPDLRQSTNILPPLQTMSSENASPSDIQSAANADQLNPTLQIAAALSNPSDWESTNLALRETPGDIQAWEAYSNAGNNQANWEGLGLKDPASIANLAASYAKMAENNTTITGYYQVVAYLYGYAYSLNPTDQYAAKAAEAYALTGNGSEAKSYAGLIKDGNMKTQVNTWLSQTI